MGKAIERVGLLLELEEFRLQRWGERAGLLEGLDRDLRLNWALIKRLLTQLTENILNINILRTQYGLEYDDSDETALVAVEASITPIQTSTNLFGRAWAHVNPTIRKSRKQVAQRSADVFRRLKWVEIDQEKARGLLAGISYYNDVLQECLDDANQQLIRRALAMLLRDMTSRTRNGLDIETIQAFPHDETMVEFKAVDAASRVKQTRLIAGVDRKQDERPSESVERLILPKVKLDNVFQYAPVENVAKWSTAIYKSTSRHINSHVLLEWKHVDRRLEKQVRRRVQSLAILMVTAADDSFHTLACLGYLEKPSTASDISFAFVFELINLEQVTDHSLKSAPLPLSTILNDNGRKPTLNERFAMAFAVSENLLQLHTAGWLHKNICSDNIVFLTTIHQGWEHENYQGPFVVGYEFSRSSVEETESMPYHGRYLLYAHPQLYHRRDDPTVTFLKEFDLHALGCLLLEIILWQPLENILSVLEESNPTKTGLDEASQSKSEAMAKLLRQKQALSDRARASALLGQIAVAGGMKCRRAVETCFFSESWVENGIGFEGDSSSDMVELSVGPQSFIVSTFDCLRKCV
ncbi:hypothetical protein H2198_001832 [Neophaeococcomyces mojaviensis]|uniref:Uncharacterized protein n=1 Tax=Neophaeococcomyces mojaviensis TaxID=3383035 RepID=A0ACC3AGJ4_9EURO|nr:hypothetical protein H2198_001832 [Knufia sp. JES_112]